jgi:hypothetical protein
MTIGLLCLPFVILWVLVKILPPWPDAVPQDEADAAEPALVTQ